jgi:hypothetical protein
MTQKLHIITKCKDLVFFLLIAFLLFENYNLKRDIAYLHDGLMSSFSAIDETKFQVHNMKDFLSPLVEEIGIEDRDN